jgi:phage major head subunit gpT-like protein
MALPVYAPQMVRKDIRGEFIEALMVPRPPLLIERIATIIQSTSNKENYGWLSEPPIMEQHMGEMPMHTLSDTGLTAQTGSDDPGYEVVNNTYAGALVFRRDDLADEKVGGYRQRIQDQAARATSFPDNLLITKLVAGESDTCYIQVGATGEAMFSASHAARGEQSSTWSNLLTGNGTAVANFQTDIAAAVAALYNMTDEAAQPMNRHCRQMFVLYPPAIDHNLRTAVRAGVISQTSNVGYQDVVFELIPEPLLTATDANDYYVGILDAPVRGLIWQDREAVQLEEIGEGSEMWTNQRQIEYATTRRGAAAFGFPQRLIKITNT